MPLIGIALLVVAASFGSWMSFPYPGSVCWDAFVLLSDLWGESQFLSRDIDLPVPGLLCHAAVFDHSL